MQSKRMSLKTCLLGFRSACLVNLSEDRHWKWQKFCSNNCIIPLGACLLLFQPKPRDRIICGIVAQLLQSDHGPVGQALYKEEYKKSSLFWVLYEVCTRDLQKQKYLRVIHRYSFHKQVTYHNRFSLYTKVHVCQIWKHDLLKKVFSIYCGQNHTSDCIFSDIWWLQQWQRAFPFAIPLS